MQHSPKNKINPLLKKARKKYISMNRASELRDNNPRSILKKAYKNTMFCTYNMIVDENGKVKSGGYCKNRWCATCAPIRMATLINKHEKGWKNLNDPYFVTLTDKTVKGRRLKNEIEARYKTLKKIHEKARKRKLKNFDGTRKTEVTIRPEHLYHPHHHYIIDGKENAQFLIAEWLKYCPTAKRAAQDMRPVTKKETFLEMAKYETKSIVDDISKDGKRQRQCPKRLDVVYRALHRKRTFQPFGRMMKYSKKEEEEGGFDETELEATIETDKPEGVYKYDAKSFDWYHIITKQALTKFEPSDNIKGLFGYKNLKTISEKWQFKDTQENTDGISCAFLSRDMQEKPPEFYRIDPSLAFGTANSPP